MIGRSAALLIVLAAVLSGCSLFEETMRGPGQPAAAPLPYPDGCSLYDLSPHRCEAIVNILATRRSVDPHAATSIELLGDPGCGPGVDPGGNQILCTRTTSFVVRVRFHLADGQAPEESVFCGVGGQYTILCTETPEIHLFSPMGGYQDIPCAGEAPLGCATPLPTIEPGAADDARALVVSSLDVPLDHLGAYSIDLGDAILANGILRDARFTLADLHPTAYTTGEGGIQMILASLDGGPPFVNSYEHGWRPGVERVSVALVFEITAADPGAILPLRDVVVK